MHARRIVAAILAGLTMPVVVLGLIDPVEGGVALLLAAVLGGIAWLVGRVPLPRLAWIPWMCAVGIGVLALVAVSIPYWGQEHRPRGGEGLTPALVVVLVAYELAVGVTIAGSVQYFIRVVRSVRRS